MTALAYEFCDLIYPYLLKKDLYIIGEGTYEEFGVYIDSDDIVLDIGANMGIFSAYAASKGAKVYAFEPVPDALQILRQTIDINLRFKERINIVEEACMDSSKTMQINVDDESVGANSLILGTDNQAKRIEVDCVSLDDWVRDNGVEKIDFIKADIEGAERYMLKGAKEILKEFKPKLAICTYHCPDDRAVISNIILEANSQYEIYYGKNKLYAK